MISLYLVYFTQSGLVGILHFRVPQPHCPLKLILNRLDSDNDGQKVSQATEE